MVSVAGIKTGAGGAGPDDAGAGVDGHATEAGQGWDVSIQDAGNEIFRDAPWHVGDPARAHEEPGFSFTPAPILASHAVA
jgi:hypothetical protein